MKLIDFKIACIKEIVKDETPLSSSTYSQYIFDSAYAPLMNNMMNAINLTFRRIVDLKKLPIQVLEVNLKEMKHIIKNNYLDLTKVIPTDALPFYKLDSILYVDDYGESDFFTFFMLDETKIKIPKELQNYTIYIRYYPNIRYLSDYENDELELTSLGVTDHIALYAVYGVKALLYEIEEPEIAQQYRNYFETFLATTLDNKNDTMEGISEISKIINGY